jgi:mRNA interferase HicA
MRPSSFYTNGAISRYGLAGTHLYPMGFRDGSPLRRTQGCDNLHIGHTCPILVEAEMKGSKFIRKAQMLAKVRGLPWRLDEKRGKGSHVTLYFGERMTVVRNPKDELKTGTLHAMCKQLGIRKDEL